MLKQNRNVLSCLLIAVLSASMTGLFAAPAVAQNGGALGFDTYMPPFDRVKIW